MANISHIKVNNTQYDIVDQNARDTAGSALQSATNCENITGQLDITVSGLTSRVATLENKQSLSCSVDGTTLVLS